MAARENHKLSTWFIELYEVEARVGKVAYRIKLPLETRIHNVFHVSQLKKKVGSQVVSTTFPNMTAGMSRWNRRPEVVLDRQMVKRFNRVDVKVLVQWEGLPREKATREYFDDIQERYPEFSLDP